VKPWDTMKISGSIDDVSLNTAEGNTTLNMPQVN